MSFSYSVHSKLPFPPQLISPVPRAVLSSSILIPQHKLLEILLQVILYPLENSPRLYHWISKNQTGEATGAQ